jgi:glutathionyl-hydroquinone reductase
VNSGWRFVTKDEKQKPAMSEPEPLFGLQMIRELYFKANPDYNGRFTVPVLWDTKTSTVVNNESSELIVMLNNEFNNLAKYPELDLYPEALRDEIDKTADSFYKTLNNGVYRCGFATTQGAYDEAFSELFETLDVLEARLGKSRYLCGNQPTLADIRLFPTLIRFDAVYVLHFKTNLRMLKEYPNLRSYTSELYQMPSIRATVNFDHIKAHYFTSHPTINPHGIIPGGPDLSYLDQPHGRAKMV